MVKKVYFSINDYHLKDIILRIFLHQQGNLCVKLAGYSNIEQDDTQLIVSGNDKYDISDDVCKLALALKDMTRNQIKDFFSLPQTQDCFCLACNWQ